MQDRKEPLFLLFCFLLVAESYEMTAFFNESFGYGIFRDLKGIICSEIRSTH